MFCLYTFPAHNLNFLVMGSNPGYLLKSFFTFYLPLCIVRGLWAHFRILPQCYWLLPWTNLAPSIGFPLCQFCQWTFYVSGKKRRVEKATFHEIRKSFFLLTLQTKLSIWRSEIFLEVLDFDFQKCPKLVIWLCINFFVCMWVGTFITLWHSFPPFLSTQIIIESLYS